MENVAIKITSLELNDLEHIEKLFHLLELQKKVNQRILIDISEAFELMTAIDNTPNLKDYPEYRRAKCTIETKIKLKVPRNDK